MEWLERLRIAYNNREFLLHNCYESIDNLVNRIGEDKIDIECKGENFFLYDKNILYYFIRDFSNVDIKRGCYIYLINYHNKYFSKHENFLFCHKAILLNIFQQMELENVNEKCKQFDFIKQTYIDEIEEVYYFFIKYFPITVGEFISYDEFKSKYENLLIYKEDDRIKGALLYSSLKNYALINHLAVDRNLKCNNVAYALVNHFFKNNQDKNFYRLFVDIKNEHAIKFYKRLNFDFNNIQYRLYKIN
ncbi:GNAT family N-acetyltransferase [Campylobacter sp. IFREMER_LSEM_CL2194]|uniref:GNAT family N-acetyltransferase n=1 Tax=Campylobacter sp. IFREMER_LSEM_CL2194 TaxID=2911621 RepID=UPI0021E8D493|nr:GNAT family N-acetyltransferase [Campylobacter sp. IFREMER_LSEM_CL2194]MCV3377628.1 GNAT family N-acetyltransferase [Campylobacter sp. IFREMER_LSEM_CL2194]